LRDVEPAVAREVERTDAAAHGLGELMPLVGAILEQEVQTADSGFVGEPRGLQNGRDVCLLAFAPSRSLVNSWRAWASARRKRRSSSTRTAIQPAVMTPSPIKRNSSRPCRIFRHVSTK
jgi:hypothetical protein